MFLIVTRFGNTIFYALQWMWNGLSLIPSLWRLFKLRPPRVTFFGGSKFPLSDQYAQQARLLAQQCVQNGMTIITGGGGGIMQAAALGANRAKHRIENEMGITISGLQEYQFWPAHEYLIRVNNLIIRKWLMLNFSAACVVFPGGVGTYNEFAEILTLIDMNLFPSMVVVLYGKEYWESFLKWIADEGVSHGLVRESILKSFVLVDTPHEALTQLRKICIDHCAIN